MSRAEQKEPTKGSQKWLQVLVNSKPELFACQLAPAIALSPDDEIHWLSPLRADQYAEYSDEDFLELVGAKLRQAPLNRFWPRRGPVWDALGRTDRGHVLLVEAKAHIDELVSPPTAAGPESASRIRESLDATKRFLLSSSPHDWSGTFYQYTNRLAHLYLLRELNGVPAHLVLLYFINAADVHGPSSREEWEGALRLLHRVLGVGRHKLSPYVIDAFVDVKELTPHTG